MTVSPCVVRLVRSGGVRKIEIFLRDMLRGLKLQSGASIDLTLPFESGRLEELFEGDFVSVEKGKCRIAAPQGSAKLVLLPRTG